MYRNELLKELAQENVMMTTCWQFSYDIWYRVSSVMQETAEPLVTVTVHSAKHSAIIEIWDCLSLQLEWIRTKCEHSRRNKFSSEVRFRRQLGIELPRSPHDLNWRSLREGGNTISFGQVSFGQKKILSSSRERNPPTDFTDISFSQQLISKCFRAGRCSGLKQFSRFVSC
jgi:hypothetical protein